MIVKKSYIVFTVFLFLFAFNLQAQSNKQKKLEEKRQKYIRELKQLNTILFSNKKKEKSVITLVEDLNYKVSVRRNLIKITNDQANLLTREINTNQREITNLRAQLKQLKDSYAKMLVKSYKSKSEQSRVMFLLSSDNFKQAYKRLQYIKQYADYQKEQGEAIKLKTQKLQALNISLLKQKDDKQKLIKENRLAKKQLEIEVKDQKTLMASIRKDLGKYTSQIKRKQQEINRLDKEIDRLIRLAIAESNKKAGKSSSSKGFALTPEARRLAANFESNKGKLPWPVKRGVVKQRYGKQKSLLDKTITITSSGIKIATEKNAKVKAVFDGEISEILVMKNANPAIMIRHGNYLTIYTNLAKISVNKGDKVKTGQVIGEVFTNKKTGQTMLGFRVSKNVDYQNPAYWLLKK